MLLGLITAKQGSWLPLVLELFSRELSCQVLPRTVPQLKHWPESFGISSQAHAAVFMNMDFLLLKKKRD